MKYTLSTALLFGTSKEVIDAGYADKVLPAGRIVDEMIRKESKNCLVFYS